MAYYYILYLLAIGLVTFLAYALDKHRAKKGKWRISEKALLTLSLLGGAFGGFLAMRLLHHKTRREHWYFTVINLVGMLLHIGVTVLLFLYLT